jgi:uncharacterized membrane protein SpoIIM required for sporulation
MRQLPEIVKIMWRYHTVMTICVCGVLATFVVYSICHPDVLQVFWPAKFAASIADIGRTMMGR